MSLRICCALAILLALPAFAQDWQIGLARAKITPEEPIRMAGYASRTKPSESVSTDLWAKAMAFVDGDGGRALLITADTLGFPNDVVERICRRIGEQTGLERSAILVNASHTHAGPLLIARASYKVSGEEKRVVDTYRQQFEDRLVKIGVEAVGNLQPAHLSRGTGVAKFVMNRREFTPKGIILGTNPRGLADRSVPVLRVDNSDGKLIAVVFGAATHNTTLTGQNQVIDGDYAGHAQSAIEKQHPGVQAMFVTGCAGDGNPFPRGTLELATKHGQTLGAEVDRVLGEKLASVAGPIRTELRRVDLPLRQLTRAQIEELGVDAPSYRRFFVEGALEKLDANQTLLSSYNAPFALWQFGDDLTLVGLSGETVVDYAALTEEALGPLNLWVAGFCNDIYGYLVTTRLLEEGGYETRGLYTDVGLFAPGVEGPVISAIRDMANSAGRPVRPVPTR
jgi:neutral/alkaline ceramidase-like enzyme